MIAICTPNKCCHYKSNHGTKRCIICGLPPITKSIGQFMAHFRYEHCKTMSACQCHLTTRLKTMHAMRKLCIKFNFSVAVVSVLYKSEWTNKRAVVC